MPGSAETTTSPTNSVVSAEVEDDEEVLQQKVRQLAAMVKAARHAVVYTGARGPSPPREILGAIATSA